MTPSSESHRFAVLVPVKPPSTGKSRLSGVPDGIRRELAAAFAEDTVAAAARTPRVERVLVVTDDADFARHLATGHACTVMPDGVSGDLNGTLVQAAHEATRRWPGLEPVALCSDLPALRSDDLAAALAGCSPERAAFVADERGTGTTLYAAPVEAFAPRFGPASRAEHAAAGALELAGELSTLRRDVDDVGDLGRALVLGVGPRTAAVWGRDEGGPPAAG